MTRRKFDLTPQGTPKENKTPPVVVVDKGWGRSIDGVGEVFAYHSEQEDDRTEMKVDTVKVLHFAKGLRLSRHYHLLKKEIFLICCGSILLELWDRNGERTEVVMRTDSRVIIPPGCQHRMTGLEDNNVLLEVSTLDREGDSYRIEKGD